MLNEIKNRFYEENKIIINKRIIFPKIILTFKSNISYNIEELRNSRLDNHSSPEKSFIDDFPRACCEIPIFIMNRGLWDRLCDMHGISKNSPERFRNLHLVDFLFVRSSVVVELDSPYHDSRKVEDMIRDKYLLLEHGLKVIRYNGLDYKNHMDEIISETSINREFTYPNFQSLSDEYFEKQYSSLIEGFTNLFIYADDIIDPKLKGIILTNKDLNYLGWTEECIPDLNNWLSAFIQKSVVWINTDIEKDRLIEQYRNNKRKKKGKIYKILTELGYL